jgi:hypothetical protein
MRTKSIEAAGVGEHGDQEHACDVGAAQQGKARAQWEPQRLRPARYQRHDRNGRDYGESRHEDETRRASWWPANDEAKRDAEDGGQRRAGEHDRQRASALRRSDQVGGAGVRGRRDDARKRRGHDARGGEPIA